MKSQFNRLSILLTTAALVIAQVIMPVHAAFATDLTNLGTKLEPSKAAICKYVGTPGSDERLQSGKNPIVVDRKDDMVIGTPFTDAQGSSVVIAFLNPGDPEPSVENCPSTPDGPIPVAPVSPTANIKCGPDNDEISPVAQPVGIVTPPLDTHWNNGSRTITYSAAPGYALIGSGVFTFTDLNTVCQPDLNPVTPVNGNYTDTCGDVFNINFTPAITVGIDYHTSLSSNTLTVTAAAKAGYILTDSNWSQVITDQLAPCPVIKPCTSISQSTVSKYEEFADYNDTRANGHTEFVTDGLHIYTDGNTDTGLRTDGVSGTWNTDKVAWYNSVAPYSLADIGAPSMDYTNTAGGVPGMQIVLDKNGDGISDGILVGEPGAYGDNWWSNGAFGIAGGMGYASYGTLQDYLTANPTAKVLAVGFSLGSGVKGDGILHSLTFGCQTWVFKKAPHVAQPCTLKEDNVYTKEWTYNNVTMPEAGTDPTNSSALPGKYEFVNNALFTGIHLTTPADESYVDGLIEAGNTSILDVGAMSYTTYRSTSSTGISTTLPSYVLEIDKDGDPTTHDTSYLFYEPYYNGTVNEGTWQTWNAIDSGNAKWWMTGTGQALHTWDYFKTAFPNAIITAYGFNQGSSNAGADTYIKSMTFDCQTTTFSTPGKGGVDLPPTTEPNPTPTPTTPVTPAAPILPSGKGAVMPTELPETGSSFSPLLIGLMASAAAYGALYFAQPKRFYE